jgi:ORF6N domain
MKATSLQAANAGIEQQIHLIRGHRVMLDKDLAELYGVPTKVLNQAVSRNISRFPEDFMFQLTADEAQSLRSQIVTLKKGDHFKHLPRVFTQEGVAMLSGVLRSERAVEVNIAIMRTFVRLRQISLINSELASKLAELEGKLERHDADIETILQTLNQLISKPEPTRRRIGFHVE